MKAAIMVVLALAMCLAAVTATLPSVSFNNGVSNKQVARMVDLQSQMVEEIVSITVSATSTSKYYIVAFPASSHVSFIEAFLKGTEDKFTRLLVDQVTVTGLPDNDNEDTATSGDAKYYKVTVDLPVGRDVTIQLHNTYTRVLIPYPASIRQEQQQLVHYGGSSLFYTPYVTLQQQTQFKLPQGKIESFSVSR
jgi:hypothetical protein